MTGLKVRFLLALSQGLCVALHWTYRYRVINPEYRQLAETLHPKRGFAIASWHQNCFAGILSHAHQGIALLVSRSFDGVLISGVAQRLGMSTIRGSSRKGGREALDELIELAPTGLRSAFTVDGPKGPIYEVKRGVLHLSAMTGVPILPTMAVAKRSWTLSKSWDKFRIPKPFARVNVIYGRPFVVSSQDYETQLDALSQKLKLELHALEAQALQENLGPKLALLSSQNFGNNVKL